MRGDGQHEVTRRQVQKMWLLLDSISTAPGVAAALRLGPKPEAPITRLLRRRTN